MAKKYIRKALRLLMVERARNRCEYCQTQVEKTAMPMEVDHIIPLAMQGQTEESNLCLACTYCNDSKSDRTVGLDVISGKFVALYNPRSQKWKEHFSWSSNSENVIGLTPTGRATVFALNLNRPILIQSRRVWVTAGWHPPKD